MLSTLRLIILLFSVVYGPICKLLKSCPLAFNSQVFCSWEYVMYFGSSRSCTIYFQFVCMVCRPFNLYLSQMTSQIINFGRCTKLNF